MTVVLFVTGETLLGRVLEVGRFRMARFAFSLAMFAV